MGLVPVVSRVSSTVCEVKVVLVDESRTIRETEKLLRQRDVIDKKLEKLHVHVAVMFTDIERSTEFFDERGTTEGLVMLRRHNEIVHPLIRQASGTIVKELGDGLLMRFPNSLSALDCAVKIQAGLARFNMSKHPKSQIRVKVGIHEGLVILTQEDVFGDVVHVAKRIADQAGPGQILVSEAIASQPCNSSHRVRLIGPRELKGKGSWRLYEVIQDPTAPLGLDPVPAEPEQPQELSVVSEEFSPEAEFGYRLRTGLDQSTLRDLILRFRSTFRGFQAQSMAERLEQDLLQPQPRLRRETFLQLARWCKTGGTYKRAMVVAHDISRLLFGTVLDREGIKRTVRGQILGPDNIEF